MKVAFFVISFPKISETFILNQITGIIELGHDVKILAIKKKKIKKVHTDILKYNLLERVDYIYPKNIFTRFIKGIYLLIKYSVTKPSLVLKTLNIFKCGKYALSLKLLFFIKPFLENSFDILHCQFGTVGIYGAYIKDFLVKGRLVTSFRGYDLSSVLLANGVTYYYHLFDRGDLFLPVNEYFKNRLIKLGCSRDKILVHHSGIDINRFMFYKRQIVDHNRTKFLTVGRLVEKKGHLFVIEAIKRLVNKYSKIEYIIAGDGPLKTELLKLVNKYNLSSYVKFKGQITSSEAIDLYKEAHIFILHSITARNGDMEGTPVVLMEAQASGLPVISTYHSGVPEVVIDKHSGFLVPEKDVEAMTERMEYLINNPDLWCKMGLAGRKHIVENYNISKLNKELEKKYFNLLSKIGYMK